MRMELTLKNHFNFQIQPANIRNSKVVTKIYIKPMRINSSMKISKTTKPEEYVYEQDFDQQSNKQLENPFVWGTSIDIEKWNMKLRRLAIKRQFRKQRRLAKFKGIDSIQFEEFVEEY